MALNDDLKATVDVVRGAVPADIFSAIGQSIADLEATGIAGRAAQVGSQVAPPPLIDLSGRAADLAQVTAGRPYVLIFYRGGWCPYCNVTLRAYAKLEKAFAKAGALLVAVTPEAPERAASTIEADSVGFPVFVDRGNAFARRLGLVFALPAGLRPQYRAIGIDLPAWNGDESHELPIPAVYVIDRDGVIRWAHVEADFTTRAEPSAVLDAVKTL